LDGDGYLFLTDRRDFMIISGGVNIYPRAIEDRLIAHPAVADVAVFGIPDAEMGERVIAVVEPADGICGDDTLATALIAWARGALSGIQIPRRIDFVSALPRHANGKLYKRLLRERYLGKVDPLITS
jgi:fatty-acyl-CoA synthase